MIRNYFYNLYKVFRFFFKKDRYVIFFWLFGIIFTVLLLAWFFPGLYQNEAERLVMAETMNNPAVIAMIGKNYGYLNYTAGAMYANQMLLFSALAAAIMSILLVNRTTRVDEEEGRTELLKSFPVGRLTNLGASVLLIITVNIILALTVGFGIYFLGIETMGLGGSLLFGAILGVTGLFFGSVTALFSQLIGSSRGTLGYSFMFLGFFYLLRAIGDVGSEALALVSPLGIILRSRVFVNNYIWPLITVLCLCLILFLAALYINFSRDLGVAYIIRKKKHIHQKRTLSSHIDLLARIQSVLIIL